MTNKIICIDFDGVIHKAGVGSKPGRPIYDEPTEGAVFTLRNLAKEFELVVLTSRPKEDFKKIEEWLHSYGFPIMRITNVKPNARAYIDDRAIRFTTWSDIVHYFL